MREPFSTAMREKHDGSFPGSQPAMIGIGRGHLVADRRIAEVLQDRVELGGVIDGERSGRAR